MSKAREAAAMAMRGLNMLNGPTPKDLDAAIDAIAAGLSAEERKALLIAHEATYSPGVVAAQTQFHGRENKTGRDAANMLDGLATGGLLRFHRYGGDEYVGTISVEYKLTRLGRAVAEALTEVKS